MGGYVHRALIISAAARNNVQPRISFDPIGGGGG
jgi:hypothetical protein